MPTFKFGKLVRDYIVMQQIAAGAKPQYRHLPPEQHKQELVNKIIEEANEILAAAPDEKAAEIADVQQALDDMKWLYGLTDEAVQKAQKLKKDKNGAFAQGIFVEHVEVADGDPWAEYYRQNPRRYPEIS